MARSKDVYTVLGYLCIDAEFRQRFFEHPVKTATRLVGSLTDEEVRQIKDLAGHAMPAADRGAFVAQAHSALKGVSAAYNCPVRPCPDTGDDPAPLES